MCRQEGTCGPRGAGHGETPKAPQGGGYCWRPGAGNPRPGHQAPEPAVSCLQRPLSPLWSQHWPQGWGEGVEALSTQEGPRLCPLPASHWAPALAASGGARSRLGTWLWQGQLQGGPVCPAPQRAGPGLSARGLGRRRSWAGERSRGGGGHGLGEGRGGAELQAEKHREWALWAGWAHAAPRSLSMLGGCRPRRTREDPVVPAQAAPDRGAEVGQGLWTEPCRLAWAP